MGGKMLITKEREVPPACRCRGDVLIFNVSYMCITNSGSVLVEERAQSEF
jgi:hypothetical protein